MNCNHHFIIPPPNGAISIGICKLCGESREMFNSLDTSNTTWKKALKGQTDAAKLKKADWSSLRAKGTIT